MPSLDALAQDLRYAVRTLVKSPTYSGIVVATLALGIAANAVIFSVMNPYLVRELPYGEPDELVQLGQVEPRTGWDGARFSLAMIRDYRERSRAFEALGAYHYGGVTVADEERPVHSTVGVVTADLFDLLGVEAARGRTFLPGEDGPDGADVVVLDHGLWESRYGGDPGILGSTIRLDGVPHTVVGIMPPGFVFPWNEVKLWTPMRVDPAAEPRSHAGHIPVGRLADGWTRRTARDELEAIQRELAAAHPDADGEYAGISVLPLRQALNFAWEAISLGLPILLAAVGFVLLIVCVNVASLTLARNATREGEVAVRAAMGAGRRRLTGQFLTESGVLALAGGGLGILLAYWAVSVVGPVIPEALFRVGDVTLDRTVLAYTAAITLATPFLFGLLPALRTARTDLASTLRSGGRGGATGAGARGSRRALVVAEVALAIVLVAGAGLMLRSLGSVREIDLGFEPGRLLTVGVQLPEKEYPSQGEVAAFFEEATAQLAALPGVDGVGAVSFLPMNHEMALRDFAVPGREPPSQADWPLAAYVRVSEGYFDAMDVPVRAGRAFRERDGEADDVVIVSEALARRHLGAENPVGASLVIGNRGETETVTIVGVVGEVQQADLVYENRPQLYRPIDGTTGRRRFLVLGTDGSPGDLVQAVRDRLAAVDRNLPVAIRPMGEIVTENTFVWSVGSAVLGGFGLFALLLASLGIYGVIAYSVEHRRREMGIRMALGASRDRVRALVVGEGLRLAGAGLVVGLVLAVAAGQLMTAILFGVSPLDPVALGGTLAVFAAVAAASCWLPAEKAARSEPARVLREE